MKNRWVLFIYFYLIIQKLKYLNILLKTSMFWRGTIWEIIPINNFKDEEEEDEEGGEDDGEILLLVLVLKGNFVSGSIRRRTPNWDWIVKILLIFFLFWPINI